MRVRTSLRWALVVVASSAVALVAVPAVAAHRDARHLAEVTSVAERLELPGSTRPCDQPGEALAMRCTSTDGDARSVADAAAAQLGALGLADAEIFCDAISGAPQMCVTVARRGSQVVAVTAAPHLLEDVPLTFDGLDVSVSAGPPGS